MIPLPGDLEDWTYLSVIADASLAVSKQGSCVLRETWGPCTEKTVWASLLTGQSLHPWLTTAVSLFLTRTQSFKPPTSSGPQKSDLMLPQRATQAGATCSLGPHASGCLFQDGDLSFPLESVKQLKDLQEELKPRLVSHRRVAARLAQPVTPSLCSHSAFPEALKPLCQKPNAEEILRRLSEWPLG